MKKHILHTLIAIAFISNSCTDYTNPKIISGTIWRCSSFTDAEMALTYEYVELHFISETQVQMWEKKKNDYLYQASGTLKFTISGKTITITIPALPQDFTTTGPNTPQDITAVIENNKLTMPFTDYTLVFFKQ